MMHIKEKLHSGPNAIILSYDLCWNHNCSGHCTTLVSIIYQLKISNLEAPNCIERKHRYGGNFLNLVCLPSFFPMLFCLLGDNITVVWDERKNFHDILPSSSGFTTTPGYVKFLCNTCFSITIVRCLYNSRFVELLATSVCCEASTCYLHYATSVSTPNHVLNKTYSKCLFVFVCTYTM